MYVELHCHSAYSFLDGASQPEELAARAADLGDREVPLRPHIGIFTQPISFIGLPVAAVPVREAGRMPYGVQVIARPWREDHCLRVAAALEAADLSE